jgi:hypothetical protein
MNAATESGEMHMMDAIDGSSFSMSAWKPYGDHPRGVATCCDRAVTHDRRPRPWHVIAVVLG